jgi:hypothetical protein
MVILHNRKNGVKLVILISPIIYDTNSVQINTKEPNGPEYSFY